MNSLESDKILYILIAIIVRIAVGLFLANFIRGGAKMKGLNSPNDWYIFGFLFPFWTLWAVCFAKDKSNTKSELQQVTMHATKFNLVKPVDTKRATKLIITNDPNRCVDCNSLMAPTMLNCPKCKKRREPNVNTAL